MKIDSRGYNVPTVDTMDGSMTKKEFDQLNKLATLSGLTRFVGVTFSGTTVADTSPAKITFSGAVNGTMTKSEDGVDVNLS